MRRLLPALLVSVLALFVLFVYLDGGKHVQPSSLGDAYIERYQADTYAGNAVTAIYLNYRMYDSIFETLMLLVAVSAVVNLSWRSIDG
jgi:multicomponent Na+:H+ antiporter subunit B